MSKAEKPITYTQRQQAQDWDTITALFGRLALARETAQRAVVNHRPYTNRPPATPEEAQNVISNLRRSLDRLSRAAKRKEYGGEGVQPPDGGAP